MLGFGFNKDKVRAAAEKFVQQGKLQNAIAEYDKILKHDPKDLTVVNTVGDLYSRLGQNDQAIECFRKVGDTYASEGFVPKAIAMYKKLTKLSPNSYDAIQKLGELYTQQGLYNDARAQYLLACDGQMKNGQPEEAVKILKRILEVDPENAGVQAKLADIYLKQGKKNEAKQILFTAAEAMYQRGAMDAASDILGRLLTLDRDNPRARLLQAQVMFEKGDPSGAISALEFMPDLDSRPDGLRTMMRAYLATGRVAEAEPVARKLFNVHQDITAIVSVTEKVVATDPEKALTYYEEFGDKLIAASSTTVVNSLRGIVSKVHNNIQALETLLKLFQRAGDTSQDAEIWQLIADACARRGEEADLKRAAQLYKQLAELEPENPLHMQSYKQVVSKLGSDPTMTESKVQDSAMPVAGEDWPVTAPFTTASPEPSSARGFDGVAAFTASAAEEELSKPSAVETPGVVELVPSTPEPFSIDPEAQVHMEAAPAGESTVQEFKSPETHESFEVPAPAPVESVVEEVHDLSDEWEKHLEQPGDGLVDHAQVNEISLPDTVPNESFSAAMQSPAEIAEEIKFYISQRMWDEASSALEKLTQLTPDDPQLTGFRQAIAAGQAPAPAPVEVASVQEIDLEAPVVEAGVIEIAPPAPAAVQESAPEPMPLAPIAPVTIPTPAPQKPAAAPAAASDDILGDLVSDLESSLGDDFAIAAPAPAVSTPAPKPAVAAAAAASVAPPAAVAPAPAQVAAPVAQVANGNGSNAGLLDDLLDEFKEDLGETGDHTIEDPDTHYNLGVAFKEMGLLDEAIGELQKVCHAIDHGVPFTQTVQAYTWLANCFVEKGVPEASFMWFERALTVAPDSDSRAAILYELGSAYENANDRDKARETFTKVMAINIDFRDVGERIKALKS